MVGKNKKWVLVYFFNDQLKYYVQNYKGEEAILNGLIDNAILFDTEDDANSHGLYYEKMLGRNLHTQEIFHN